MADYAAVNRRHLIGRRRTLVTPEGVDLQLSLADGGQRVGAFLLDLVIMFAALIALSLSALAIVGAFGAEGANVGAIIWLLGFFLLRNFYFTLMEIGPRAATWGKRAVGIRVIARSGERLTADRVIARNLMREIEFYLPLSFLLYNLSAGISGGFTALAGLVWTLIFLLFPLFNKDRLRIGDLLAGTWVVKAPKRKLSVDTLTGESRAEHYRFTEAQLDVYGIYELQTLEQVLRDDQADSIASVAATIRHKIGAADEGWDRDFLVAYYDAARARMERGLLFGKRREDKFDRGS
ncbi:RDD family protein [Sphingosinicella terrae]|uniref:RDD family protein n=1 Tax=Sphingosinicella terrae TaxID=2172047 RepID=UPI000E0D943A|nr:RDD family protein [Sphingosinicella terrae]